MEKPVTLTITSPQVILLSESKKIHHEIRILKQQNDDLKKKMEDERVDAEAQRVADQLVWHKTLNDRLESFAKN
ncbi:hypothetical protein Tco_1385541 [Tanacetum coccineum]